MQKTLAILGKSNIQITMKERSNINILDKNSILNTKYAPEHKTISTLYAKHT